MTKVKPDVVMKTIAIRVPEAEYDEIVARAEGEGLSYGAHMYRVYREALIMKYFEERLKNESAK